MPNAAVLGLNTAGIISLLVGTVLPLLVGLLTRQSLNPGVKAAILAALSGVTGVLSQWLEAIDNARAFAWQQAVVAALFTWAVGELSYLRVWKPSGVAAGLQNTGITDPADFPPLAADYDEDQTHEGPDIEVPAHVEAGLAGPLLPTPVALGTAAAVQVVREQSAGPQD